MVRIPSMTLAQIALQVWEMKYRAPGDANIHATWKRIARALAAPEDEAMREDCEAQFERALKGFRFLPAGRIVAGAGTGSNVTLFNCFVMGAIPDDMGGIFAHLKEAALTMQAGGGIGYDISTLRPKGAPVVGVGADASGPLTFMDVWDSMCRTIMSAGSRRGAMMATMRCDHPDIEAFIADPFSEEAYFDEEAFDATVAAAVRMMDNVVDVSRFPLEKQRQEAFAKRRIGLGITGLADALIMMRATYGDERSLELAGTWLARLRRKAYLASIRLAREKGPFPLWDAEAWCSGASVAELDDDIRKAAREHGIRNALLTSIAPTGTISPFANNISSGLEPVFALSYTRNVLLPDGTRRSEEVTDYAVRLWRRIKGPDAPLPDYFVDAQVLKPADHVAMQAVVQKYIDSSISKTINVPEDTSFEAFKDVYLEAYRLGCKGCTTYRSNDVTVAVLEARSKDEAEPELPLEEQPAESVDDPLETGGVVHLTRPLDRPEVLSGQTYTLRWPEGDHAIYLTVNDVIRDGRRAPFEIFNNSKNMDHYAWTLGLTRMISAVFRRAGDVSFVVDELKAVFDPRGGSWMNGRYVPALLAAIGEVLETHMRRIGFIASDDEADLAGGSDAKVVAIAGPGRGMARAGCPRCGMPSLIHQEGCAMCTSCGWSRCA